MAALQSLGRLLAAAQRKRWLLPAIIATLLFGPGLAALLRLSLQEWRLSQRLQQLKAEKAKLLAERDRLQHDPVYVEGLIRTTFKVAKPGELVIPLDKRD